MTWFPEEPEKDETASARGTAPLRYEDVTQDGRVRLLGLAHAEGIVWQKLLEGPAAEAAHRGVVPILTRFVIEGGGGPVAVGAPLQVEGCYQAAHTVDELGVVNRLLINMWVRLGAPRGVQHGPPPPGAGEIISVGRLFSEHVVTRPFAPPAERKVLRFDVPGLPAVPPARWTWRPPEAPLAVPVGSRWLDVAPVLDIAPVVFGLEHTDSNRHVNSLVYPRLFNDAALRRLAAHRRRTTVLARRLEVAYRKPCFAGDRVSIAARAFEIDGTLGVVGAFVPEGEPDGRAFCTLQLTFEP